MGGPFPQWMTDWIQPEPRQHRDLEPQHQQPEPKRQQEPVAAPRPAPFKTGSKYLDEGAVCERKEHGARSCFMEEGQRRRVLANLGQNITMVHGNYLTALQSARIELLMHKKAGWGPVGAILFELAMSAMTAGIGFAVSKIAQAGVKAFLASENLGVQIMTSISGQAPSVDTVAETFAAGDVNLAKEIVKNTGKLIKPSLEAQFDSFPADVAAKGKFVNTLMNNASLLLKGVLDGAQEHGDDAVLVPLLGAYSPTYMTVDFFGASIADLLTRFDQHHLEEIGPRRFAGGVTAGTTETVLIAANGYSRLAVVRFGERKVLGRSQGETWYTDGADEFVTFVSDDLADAAIQAQRTTLGAVKVVDVHAGHRFRGSSILDAWIAQTRASEAFQRAKKQ